MDLQRTYQVNISVEPDLFFQTSELKCSSNRQLLDYWSGLKSSAGLPLAENFDIVEVHELAAWIAVADVVEGGADFRYRLVGTRFARIFGEDMSQKLLSDFSDDGVVERVRAVYIKAVLSTGPACSSGKIGNTHGRAGLHSEACTLPLADQNGDIVRLVHMIRLKTKGGNWQK